LLYYDYDLFRFIRVRFNSHTITTIN